MDRREDLPTPILADLAFVASSMNGKTVSLNGSVDLIRFEGEGNGVYVRITGLEPATKQGGPATLIGEVVVETPFVKGRLPTWIIAADLDDWQDALDALDAGNDAHWRDDKRSVGIIVEYDRDGERAYVTVSDPSTTLTSVRVAVPLQDQWFDHAYRRIEQVVETWSFRNSA